jgi:3-methyl-2-oxobutanoate hydroxymethyltransferase
MDKRITISDVREMKARGEKIAMLTAYDYATARYVDDAGLPLILVGDSLGEVMLGYPDTLHVSIEDMLRHTAAVARGVKHALIVGDMPFMTYQLSAEEAMRNAARFLTEGNAQAVKMEGGSRQIVETVTRLTSVGIPVMGHLGLTPQSINQLGGHKVQGRTRNAAQRMLDEALALEQAGAFAVVLETVPSPLAALISRKLTIPTIGIGAGAGCDGQVQVIHDVIGLTADYVPRHAKQYAQVGSLIAAAARDYLADVRSGNFPTEAQSFKMDESVLEGLE